MIRAMLSFALVFSLSVQDPTPPPPTPPEPAPAAAAIAEWTDAEAKAALKAFDQAFKKGRASMRDKLAALEALGKGSHKRLVRPLTKVVIADPSLEVRKQAAKVLGNQPPRDASRASLALLDNPKVTAEPAVMAALVEALSGAGYDTRMWRHLDSLFERDYAIERVPLQKALLGLIAEHKETGAWPLLLRNLDEPIPADPDSPTNPPASYWEARWKSWQIWRADVKAAMFAITGQRFSTAAEAKEWADKNGAKVGL